MRKITGLMMMAAVIAMFVAGCQKQEGQQSGSQPAQPESAQTSTAPAAPAQEQHK